MSGKRYKKTDKNKNSAFLRLKNIYINICGSLASAFNKLGGFTKQVCLKAKDKVISFLANIKYNMKKNELAYKRSPKNPDGTPKKRPSLKRRFYLFLIKLDRLIEKIKAKTIHMRVYDSVDALHEHISVMSDANMAHILKENKKRSIERGKLLLKEINKKNFSTLTMIFNRCVRVLNATSPIWTVVIVGIFAANVFSYINSHSIALAVSVDNKVIGYASNQEDVLLAVRNLEEQITDEIGEEYFFDTTPVLSLQVVENNKVTDTNDISSVLYDKAHKSLDQTYGLYVNDTLYCSVVEEDDIIEALDKYKAYYIGKDVDAKCEITDSIKIEKAIYSRDMVVSADELYDMLATPKDKSTYTVVRGDTSEQIADDYGLTVAQLKQYNPNENLSALQIGAKLYVSRPEINLNVKVTKTITYTQAINFDVEKISSSALFKGQQKVKTQGEKGVKTFEAEVVLVNGEQISKKVTSEKVTKKPVNKVVLIGTKNVTANGSFIWPLKGGAGTITSTFYSWRKNHQHNALDIAAPRGTTIKASEAGTVVFSGWNTGGGGWSVVIDHGNNIYSSYMHCSSLYVSVGQKVPQGFAVAAVGSTGYSTGNHVHFQIYKKINGEIRYIDPLTKVKR